MICVFDAGNENYEGNGDTVLMPTECRHTQAAAGRYDLTITHPLDPYGKWTHIVEEAIIRAPVPEETIETAYSGMDVDVYTVNGNGTALRSGASEPVQITYSAWAAANDYSVGDKVTFAYGINHKNYQCVKFDAEDTIGRNRLPPSSSWWAPIADMTSGAPVLLTMKAGTELYFVEDAGSGWYKMSTRYGMEGYVKSSQVTYSRHLTPSETQPRTIRTQLFRIRTVNIDSKNRTVTATAEHVSYDMRGVLVKGVKISRRNPAQSLAWIEEGCMMGYPGTIATDMTSDDDGSYTGEFNGKNLVYALLDPDKGMVGSFGAMFRRDNWDVFVMRKTETDRGFRLRYGKNMLGVTWNRKSDSLVTRVVPVAKAADGSDFFLDNDGAQWVDSEYIDDYPVIRMEWLRVNGQVGKDDGTESATNWTETTLRAEMQRRAEERFSVDKADRVIHEVTVDFEQLGDTEEYRTLKGLETALMYDKVLVINETVGLSVSAEVVEIEYDCIREKIRALKLSNVNAYGGKNVAGFNVINNSITGDKLTDDVGQAILGTTKDDAVDESKSYTNSAVWNLQSWVEQNFVHN